MRLGVRVLKYVWASPGSLIGLLCVPLAWIGGGRAEVVDGVLEVSGGMLRKILSGHVPVIRYCAAMTLGHVVIGQNAELLESTREHERVHVRQYERWGPFFIPVYLLASLIARLRGGHPYLDNPFEKQAFRESGVS
jgi:hypothetical protein